jgi:hypothetical protein
VRPTLERNLSSQAEKRFLSGAREAGRYFMNKSNVHDVIELIRINGLGEELAGSLHPYVREKFHELWQAAQVSDNEE